MIEEIRSRHQALEQTVETQSAKVLRELRSQAHKDRGELLRLIKDLKERNAALLMELASERESSD